MRIQVWRVPVRPISSSLRLPTQPLDKRAYTNAVFSTNSRLGGSSTDVPLLVRAAMAENRPNYSGNLVCYRDNHYIGRSALFDLLKPRIRLLVAVQDTSRAMYQQRAQVRVATE